MTGPGALDSVAAVFDRTFAVAMGGNVEPFSYQRELARVWPKVLVAPTGSGKTAAVTLAWAARRLTFPADTPRRLVWCFPMRTLVEQTSAAARQWFGRLQEDGKNDDGRLPTPEDVFVLMGGVDSRVWIDNPERPAILVGTQDMLLSRALMRGYASSRALWPMEFALLHEDAQWVFDEVQLMGAGRTTSAQLEAFRRCDERRAVEMGFPARKAARSLWVSATLRPDWLETVDHDAPPSDSVVTVRSDGSDDRLAERARAAKRVRCASSSPTSNKRPALKQYVEQLAEEILDAHRTGRMTLAIVNRVDRAQALALALERSVTKRDMGTPELALVHSRFRPADRRREMQKVTGERGEPGTIVVATQAIEAGVDISAAVLVAELAPWSSMVQRFGRANRYAEVPEGAEVRWIDLFRGLVDEAASERDSVALALPYAPEDLQAARERLANLDDAAPVHLLHTDDIEPARRVIRRKDLEDLFDTDPDLTGFDVDVSHYIRDADDTDVHVFWRDLSGCGEEVPRPRREELCAVPIGTARKWLKKVRKLRGGSPLVFTRDPQWRRHESGKAAAGAPAGWSLFDDQPWPGLVLLADRKAGGYNEQAGFTGDPGHVPCEAVLTGDPVAERASRDQPSMASEEAQGHDEDPMSGTATTVVSLADHLCHVTEEMASLCKSVDLDPASRAALVLAARWHDLGKAHSVFQDTMRRGLDGRSWPAEVLLAKTVRKGVRHKRRFFRHELASAMAFLAHEGWSREADLTAYLIAAHHGKVRMNLRALPREASPSVERVGVRYARGVWEGDELPAFDLQGGERWEGHPLLLTIMEMGWDDESRESWTERTRGLLAERGPFRLAWLETLVRIADWRASAKERDGEYGEG